MKFRQMKLACSCGRPPSTIQRVGLTSEYELVVHWNCTACGRIMYSVKSLADCCRECPDTDDSAEMMAPGARFAPAPGDAEFLRSLGISA